MALSYTHYALIVVGIIAVMAILYWRWRKISSKNKSLETELKVLQPFHKGPEQLPRASAGPAPAINKEQNDIEHAYFERLLFAGNAAANAPPPPQANVFMASAAFSAAPKPTKTPAEGSIVELPEELVPESKTPPRLPVASFNEESDEEPDDEEGPPPLMQAKVEPVATLDAAGGDPAVADHEAETEVVAAVEVAAEPVAAPRGRPGRKPKAKTA